MNIIWHSNQLSFRGTEVGLYNYADAAERILGYKSYIACPKRTSTLEALEKFKKKFEVILYNSLEDRLMYNRKRMLEVINENYNWIMEINKL